MGNAYSMDEFSIDITLEDVIRKLHLIEEEDIELMSEKLNQALAIAKPKAFYKVFEVSKIENDKVFIGSQAFVSEQLALRLAGVHNVIAHVITCGQEVDVWSHQESDYFVALWLDMLKEMILGRARKQCYAALSAKYGIDSFSTMSPGSGDLDVWPIGEQKKLFALLGDVYGEIGVQLTENCLMVPIKSVSGILFPSNSQFITCSLCSREHCPNRRAPYAG